MTLPEQAWPSLLRRHRMRLRIVEYMQAAYRPALVASAVLLCIGLISQFMLVPWRSVLVFIVVVTWMLATLFVHRRRWHQIADYRRLDVAYGWQSALITMVEHATRPDVVATLQRSTTLDMIRATPVTYLAYPPLRIWASWLAPVVLILVIVGLPTPFDAQIMATQRIREVAQTTAQTLAELPAVSDMNLPILQQQLAAARDAQGLLATLTQAQSTLERAQTANQTWQQALNQARTADTDQIDSATMGALSGAQRELLDAAILARQQGNMQPLDDLQAAAQTQSQTLAEWQQALSQSAAQTRAQAPNQFAMRENQTENQQGNGQQGNGQQGNGQQGNGQQGNGQQGNSQQGNGQQGNGQQGNGQQGNGQQGNGQQGNSQQSGGSGAGRGSGGDDVSLFVPGLNDSEMLTIPTRSDDERGRDVQTSDTAGVRTSADVTYADVVRQASDQASQAIESAQIPWTSEGIVRDYFRQLQGEQP